MISYDRASAILCSLPISYYTQTRNNIKTFLDRQGDETYVQTDGNLIEIHVGYKMLLKLNAELSESDVRTLFYHEISHILDNTLGRDEDKSTSEEYNAAFNIIADERIETIYENYFLDVDFKRVKRKLIKINEKSKSCIEHFLWYVRLKHNVDKYSAAVINAVRNAIRCGSKSTAGVAYQVFKDEFFKNLDECLDVQQTNEDYFISPEEYELSVESVGESDSFVNSEHFKESAKISNIKSFNAMYDKEDPLNGIFDEYIETALRKQRNRFSAISSYSGILNTRAVVNKDYRWWKASNRDGAYKSHNKMQINFIIDNSASFCHNTRQINSLITELNTLERKYDAFNYRLATINTSFEIWSEEDKQNKKFSTYDGNRFFETEIKEYFRSNMRDEHTEYFNIVLFDGDAFSYDNCDAFSDKLINGECERFRVLDRPDVSLITERSNADYIEDFKFADITICDDYVSELIDNIAKVMQKFYA